MTNQLYALQWYYTSCKVGLSGRTGFQTRAQSDGLNQQVEYALREVCKYFPPKSLEGKYRGGNGDATSQKVTEEILDKEFPTTFRIVTLKTGERAILRTKITGSDYSGRWGNYFTHALLLNDNRYLGWPIDLISWDGWKKWLTNEEENSEPIPLPAISIDFIEQKSPYSFPTLSDTIVKYDPKGDILRKMLYATFHRKSTSRTIMIREDSEEMRIMWMAAITKSFPPSVQTALSCSTYQSNTSLLQAINGTTSINDLPDMGTLTRSYYLFDFIDQTDCVVPPICKEYVDTIVDWMLHDVNKLISFHQFSCYFDYPNVDENIIQLIRIYLLSTGELKGVSSSDLPSFLEFISTYTKEDAFVHVLNLIPNITEKILDESEKSRLVVLKFLLKAATQAEDKEQRRVIVKLYVENLCNEIIDNRKDVSTIIDIRHEILGKSPEVNRFVSESLLSQESVEYVCNRIEDIDYNKLISYYKELIYSYKTLQRSPFVQQGAFQLFLDAVFISNKLENILDILTPFEKNEDAIADAIKFMLKRIEYYESNGIMRTRDGDFFRRNMGLALYEWIVNLSNSAGQATKDEQTSKMFGVLSRLITETRALPVISANFAIYLEKQTAKSVAWEKYQKSIKWPQVLDLETKTAFYDTIDAVYLGALPKERRIATADSWLRDGLCEKRTEQFVYTVLSTIAENISFSPNDTRAASIEKKVLDAACKLGYSFNFTRIELRKIILVLDASNHSYPTNGSLFDRVDNETYSSFLEAAFPLLIKDETTTFEQFVNRLNLIIAKHKNKFFAKELSDYIKNNKKESFTLLDEYLLLLCLSTESIFSNETDVKSELLQSLSTHFAYFSKKDQEKARQEMEKHFSQKEEISLLDNFFKEVEQVDVPFYKKVTNVCKDFLT